MTLPEISIYIDELHDINEEIKKLQEDEKKRAEKNKEKEQEKLKEKLKNGR